MLALEEDHNSCFHCVRPDYPTTTIHYTTLHYTTLTKLASFGLYGGRSTVIRCYHGHYCGVGDQGGYTSREEYKEKQMKNNKEKLKGCWKRDTINLPIYPCTFTFNLIFSNPIVEPIFVHKIKNKKTFCLRKNILP